MDNEFTTIKEEILRRAKEAKACKPQYTRAYQAADLAELMQVIKDNFSWACGHKVITADLMEAHKEAFAAHEIYCNQSACKGYLLCDNATVKAYDNATVEAWDNATVEAWDNATVKAWGNATVKAYGNVTVKAYDNATVWAYNYAYVTSSYENDVKLADNAIYRIRECNTIRYAATDIIFEKIEPFKQPE